MEQKKIQIKKIKFFKSRLLTNPSISKGCEILAEHLLDQIWFRKHHSEIVQQIETEIGAKLFNILQFFFIHFFVDKQIDECIMHSMIL